jgi:hypothetical protein
VFWAERVMSRKRMGQLKVYVQGNEQGYDEIKNWKYSIWVSLACID